MISEALESMHFWEMVSRTTFAFITLMILARLMGKKQISQLTFFHYVTGITIGSIAADIAAQSETPFLNGAVGLIWWALLTVFVNYLTMKSKKARKLFDDSPTIVIHRGKISEQGMKKARLTLNDLNMMLREQSIFTVTDVNYAILETNGQLSVMKKASQEAATRKDVKAPGQEPKYIPTEIISDGNLIKENLTELNLTEEWVYEQLKKNGIGKVEQVYYAEITGDGSLHIDMRTEDKK
ncbi:YetF domain-containing protein [Sporosarcina sp. SAFN-015]|uniref:YetF domain-containing protein n=1 Tax=Sporosarcina sp. SAFN-015 TaxID=3387274 RepID=UPI003F7FB593